MRKIIMAFHGIEPLLVFLPGATLEVSLDLVH